MTRFLRKPLLGLFSVLLLGLFWFPSAVSAETVCCDCKEAASPTASLCIQFTDAAKGEADCGALQAKSTNQHVKALTCTKVLGEAECRTITENGICPNPPVNALSYVSKTLAPAEGEEAPPRPVLGVAIPGLEFGEATPIGGGVLRIPWLAQYISAAYRYLTVIAVVAAAIMILYGGFRYIVGSTSGDIQTGKRIITDALIGLFLVLGAYTILTTVNPVTTQLKDLNLQIVHRRDAFDDPALERQRVEEAARIKKPVSPGVSVPIVYLEETPVGDLIGTTTTAQASFVSPRGDVGEVAKDTQGNLVAQGRCPIDMLPIQQSDAYTSKKELVKSFCMDIYEAPNKVGAQPILGAMEWEAEWYCNERGKRLCTTSEWIRACTGPDANNTYGYGPEYIPGVYIGAGQVDSTNVVQTNNPPAPCNYDTPTPVSALNWTPLGTFSVRYYPRSPEESMLNPNNPRLTEPGYTKSLDSFLGQIAKTNKSEPSGTRPCVSAEGIHDLSGNVSEFTIKTRFAELTTEQRIQKAPINTTGAAKPYNWMGFYWHPVPHQASWNAKPTCDYGSPGVGSVHGIGHRDYAVGFRCCLSLDP